MGDRTQRIFVIFHREGAAIRRRMRTGGVVVVGKRRAATNGAKDTLAGRWSGRSGDVLCQSGHRGHHGHCSSAGIKANHPPDVTCNFVRGPPVNPHSAPKDPLDVRGADGGGVALLVGGKPLLLRVFPDSETRQQIERVLASTRLLRAGAAS